MSEGRPETKRIKARDVRPYHWGIWCTVGDDPKPFVNSIEGRSWSDDGSKIWFMLGTHNFHCAAPDEELDLVAVEASWPMISDTEWEREQVRFFAERPVPTVACPTCGHKPPPPPQRPRWL